MFNKPLHLCLLVALICCSCRSETQTHSADDLPRKDALLWNEDLCLPQNAKRVFVYEQISGLQDLERFYRFTVDPTELDLAMKEAMAICERKMGRKFRWTQGAMSPSVYDWPHWAKSRIKWWTPDLIVSGSSQISSESYGLRIWGDSKTGDVYVYQGD